MANHPNRSEAALKAALAQYQQTAEYEVLTQVPVRADKIIEALQNRVDQAFKSGFKAGRQSKSK